MANFSSLKNKKKSNRLKGATLLFLLTVCVLVFSMGIVRGKCISKGYTLSKMATEIENCRLQAERIESDRISMVNKETLFSLASEKGFILMQEGKTFNVER